MDSLPLFLCTINPKEIRSKFFDTSHYRNTTVVKGSRPERGSTSAVNCQKEKERGREREGGKRERNEKRKIVSRARKRVSKNLATSRELLRPGETKRPRRSPAFMRRVVFARRATEHVLLIHALRKTGGATLTSSSSFANGPLFVASVSLLPFPFSLFFVEEIIRKKSSIDTFYVKNIGK